MSQGVQERCVLASSFSWLATSSLLQTLCRWLPLASHFVLMMARPVGQLASMIMELRGCLIGWATRVRGHSMAVAGVWSWGEYDRGGPTVASE